MKKGKKHKKRLFKFKKLCVRVGIVCLIVLALDRNFIIVGNHSVEIPPEDIYEFLWSDILEKAEH